MSLLICFHCGDRFDTRNGYAGITLARGRTALEQLRHGRSLHVCDECSEVLGAWLGIPPEPVAEAVHVQPHPRPYSACNDTFPTF